MTDLYALIARLEAAEAGSHELDKAVAVACGSTINVWAEIAADGTFLGSVRPVTTSLDAALALADRVLGTDQEYEITTLYNIARVTLNMNHGDESGPFYGSNDCCVVPLAICAATLRAKLDGYAAK